MKADLLSLESQPEAAESSYLNPSLILLVLFLILRPITLASEFSVEATEFGMNSLELFAVFSTFLSVLAVFVGLKRLKLDLLSGLLIYYSGYCALSLMWGSEIGRTARAVLPFFVFFATRVAISNSKSITVCLSALAIGYIYPLIGSAILTLKGASIETVGYRSGIERYRGVYHNIHTLGHTMTYFSFLFASLFSRLKGRRAMRIVLVALLLVSVLCLYRSYTRTAFLGFFVFWITYLWGTNKKYLLFFILGMSLVMALQLETVKTIFWTVRDQKQYKADLNAAGSGRVSLWSHNINAFIEFPIDRKLIGAGLGTEAKRLKDLQVGIASSHNDYLSLLVTLGLLGLTLYLLILVVLLRDVITSRIDKRSKYLFLGAVIAVILMNGVSNSYITRFELSQLFWFLMGLFYAMKGFGQPNKALADGRRIKLPRP